MHKIIIITCYYGELPWYFNFFLESCGNNQSIDFLIYSDCKFLGHVPPNVNIVPSTLEEFNRRASNKLGFKIKVKSAYKLCDFKPAYGIIFSDYIKNYDFWGITDIDIIFGRIREFITDELLGTYEVISVRNDYPTGHFMLFKNTQVINLLFTKSKDYLKVFCSDKHYCFDECNFKHGYLEQGGDIFDLNCEIESMHHIIKQGQKNRKLAAHFDFFVIEGLPGNLKLDKGILSFKGEFEVLLYHLIVYKANLYTRKKKWKRTPEILYIDKYSFRKKDKKKLIGALVYHFHNQFKPALYRFIYNFDETVSRILSIRKKNIKTRIFTSGDNTISIYEKNEGNELTFNESKHSYPVIKSFFFSKNLYLKGFSSFWFKIENDKLIQCALSGNLYIFKDESI
ncbi:DUF6625 family protein [Maribacter litoralis]|uniref:DUF6625 family protein n=1 Tax=Maribacter litoralis TaxID=2059726 RepID=UPI003F5CC7E5